MAPRLLPRAWTGRGRGVGLALCLGLAGSAATAQTIVGAWFDGPTTRYGHAILGDGIEYGALIIETVEGTKRTRYRIVLPEDHVFEDLAPRLWDITGDGAPEVVVIETDLDRGGSLAVYDQTGKIAETPHIGRTNRWLAPIGSADLDGDGRMEVAFIDRPHLAKVLRVFEWDGRGLRLEAEVAGLTNHRIGEDFISGGVRDCGAGPELVTVDDDWSDVMVTVLRDGRLQTRSIGVFAPDRLAEALDC